MSEVKERMKQNDLITTAIFFRLNNKFTFYKNHLSCNMEVMNVKVT